MKTFYSEYVRHCLRFYVRHPTPNFDNDSAKLKWEACNSALNCFTEREKELLTAVYAENDTFPDNVYKVSEESRVKQNTLWNIINRLERSVAERMNLI